MLAQAGAAGVGQGDQPGEAAGQLLFFVQAQGVGQYRGDLWQR